MRLKWTGYIFHYVSYNRVVKRILEWNLSGRRWLKRPRKDRVDYVEEDLHKSVISRIRRHKWLCLWRDSVTLISTLLLTYLLTYLLTCTKYCAICDAVSLKSPICANPPQHSPPGPSLAFFVIFYRSRRSQETRVDGGGELFRASVTENKFNPIECSPPRPLLAVPNVRASHIPAVRSGLPLSSWNSAGVPCWEPAPDIWRRHSTSSALCWLSHAGGTVHQTFNTRWPCLPTGFGTCVEQPAVVCQECTVADDVPSRAEDCTFPVVVWQWLYCTV